MPLARLVRETDRRGDGPRQKVTCAFSIGERPTTMRDPLSRPHLERPSFVFAPGRGSPPTHGIELPNGGFDVGNIVVARALRFPSQTFHRIERLRHGPLAIRDVRQAFAELAVLREDFGGALLGALALFFGKRIQFREDTLALRTKVVATLRSASLPSNA